MLVYVCRLLHQWVSAGDHPDSCAPLVQQLPAANAGALRLIMQTCSYVNEHAAVNEMDAQALAEVLAHAVAWKPAPKSERPAGPGPWQGLTKALTLNRPSQPVGESGSADMTSTTSAAAEGEAAGEAAATAAAGDRGGQAEGGAAEVHKVTPLDDAELDAIVMVLEYMISNYSSVFEV